MANTASFNDFLQAQNPLTAATLPLAPSVGLHGAFAPNLPGGFFCIHRVLPGYFPVLSMHMP